MSSAFRRYFNSLRLDLRLVQRALVRISLVFHAQQLEILFGMAALRFVNGGPHVDFWRAAVVQMSKWVQIGRNSEGHNMRPTTPDWTLALHCGQLELLTSNDSTRHGGALLKRGLRAVAAPDSSRRQPEATHEVFLWTRKLRASSTKTRKSSNILFHARETLLNSSIASSPMKIVYGFHQQLAHLRVGRLNYVLLYAHHSKLTYPKSADRKISFLWGIYIPGTK